MATDLSRAPRRLREEVQTTLGPLFQPRRLERSAYHRLLVSAELERLTERMLAMIARHRGDASAIEGGDQERVPPTVALHRLDRLTAAADSLAEHLSRQLRTARHPARLLLLGDWIIWNLEPDGYLRLELADLTAGAGAPVAELEDALRLVQSLDPAGVGARSLRECLLLQLRAQA